MSKNLSLYELHEIVADKRNHAEWAIRQRYLAEELITHRVETKEKDKKIEELESQIETLEAGIKVFQVQLDKCWGKVKNLLKLEDTIK